MSASKNPNQSREAGTVICGAGIIGCATAYYLSLSSNTKRETIHLIEASPELFASASGKSGGFLASDWFGPSIASLGELSFRLHRELAENHKGYQNWGYSRSTGVSMMDGGQSDEFRDDWLRNGGSRAETARIHDYQSNQDNPAWLTKRRGDQVDMISDGVAQVDPLRLCQFLLRESIDRGVQLHQPAEAVRLEYDESGTCSRVRIKKANEIEQSIPCSRLLLTCGAWTPRVFKQLFPSSSFKIPITQLAGHSLVVRSPRWTQKHENEGCHAVFTTMRSGFSPEIFSRIGEEIYVAGLNDASIPLPERATDGKIDRACIEQLKNVSNRLLSQEGSNASDTQIVREGLCFRPVTRRGTPILSKISVEKLGSTKAISTPTGGVYVAAGHGPWGISHSLGTGKVMAEMLEGQPTSADIRGLRI